MAHLGDFDASAVIYGKFTTYRPSTGAAFTLGGTPALSVYKDNSTTESTTGVTLTADFDSRTGLNHFAIDTSADGTFYSAGSFFDIVITTGTVDGVSVVGAVVASFTIRKNSSLKPVTAGRTVVVDAAGLVDANAVKVGPSGSGTAQTARDIGASVLLSAGTGTGQLDFTSGVVKANVTQFGDSNGTFSSGRPEVNASHINGVATTSVTAVNANVGTTQPINFTGTAGSALVKSDTVDIAGAAVSTSSAQIGVNVVSYASGQAPLQPTVAGRTLDVTATGEAGIDWANIGAPTTTVNLSGTTIKTATDVANDTGAIKTKTDNLPSDPADASDIAGAFSTVNGTLATIAGYVDTEVAAIKAVTDKLDDTLELTSDGYIFTEAALQQAPSGTGASPSAIAAAVWDEDLSGHSTAGSAGKVLDDAGSEVSAIKAKTDNLSANPADVSDIPTAVENADALLNRDMSAVTDSNSRSPLNALRFLRNKWDVSGATLTVKKEDDSTSAWTATVSTSPGADPISGSDPA